MGAHDRFAHNQITRAQFTHNQFAAHNFHGLHNFNRTGFNRNAFGNGAGWHRWGGRFYGAGWNNWGHGWGGWAGPVFWPFLLGDIFSFAFWPYGYYDPFWAYGPAFFLASIFAPGPYFGPEYGYGPAYYGSGGYYAYAGSSGGSPNIYYGRSAATPALTPQDRQAAGRNQHAGDGELQQPRARRQRPADRADTRGGASDRRAERSARRTERGRIEGREIVAGLVPQRLFRLRRSAGSTPPRSGSRP